MKDEKVIEATEGSLVPNNYTTVVTDLPSLDVYSGYFAAPAVVVVYF